MKKVLLGTISTLLFISCQQPKETADLLVFNANIYTVDDSQAKAEAFVVKDDKFIAVGSLEEVSKTYTFTDSIDAEGKTIVPGLIDAHCHFYGLGLQQQKVDLVGTTSYDEVLTRIVDFQKKKKVPFITGRGWDQNDWEIKEFPTKERLDSLFPETPVAMTRVDGHAMLVNQTALDLAKITVDTKVSGGEIVQKNGKLTGVLIDNPMEMVEAIFPQPTITEQVTALKDAEKINFSYGLTTVDDAGLSPEVIAVIDSLQKTDQLKIRMYAMVSNVPSYVDHYLKNGVHKTDKLNVSSFKVYADGALGSRGAVLKKPYSDKENHHGAMVIGVDEFKELARKLAGSPFQMNTHAIGDSANAVVINTYYDVLKDKSDRRWRVEHAQVVSPEEFDLLNDNLVMSVQPTHATSDMYWADERLGEKRIKGAYAYKQLLEKTGKVALGTDYPVENVSPFYTFYAAVARKDLKQYPAGGFQKQDALTREETLKGMTIWAAYSNFEETEKGSITAGKFADFVILEENIMEIEEDKIPNIKVNATYLGGEKVY
ncbi:amidohydrolase [Aquimarina sp. BL5]|uniref:amidohydrolase n=1 Tax=Aquimarina sp. BL5 TaxID=1714860 RepID=UPI000E4CFE1B|nr:amidohydrolase [Aquimarina sp. BL5]AXT50884.1 amidohydrolase [Aquimarina sp. BL5]RKN02533.1 amidohydrolase [Aquimarina sp. BL5]